MGTGRILAILPAGVIFVNALGAHQQGRPGEILVTIGMG